MKRKIFTAAIAALALVGGLTVNHIFASSVTPGTSSDPLVSKSYVDAKINELAAMISNTSGGSASGTGTAPTMPSGVSQDQLLADVMEQLEIYYADALGGAGQYTPVSLTAGQVLLGGEGTEIILRSGSARGYVNGVNGIVNATDGTEVFNNSNVVVNNLLIVPRDDGRGVEALTDAWFIIKGDYTILN